MEKTRKNVLGLVIALGVILGITFSPIKLSLVISGSMEPNIPTNSMYMINTAVPYEDIKEGDIIQYYTDEFEEPVIHRVRQVSDVECGRVLLTCGDNNEMYDSWSIKEEQYIGKYIGGIKGVKPYFDLFYGDISKITNKEFAWKFIGITGTQFISLVVGLFGIFKFINYLKKKVRSLK